MRGQWPIVRLGEIVSHRKEFIEIDWDTKYKRCRVQTSARGIVLRDKICGAEIKTKKQQVCKSGEFLVAEIDAKLGGYGIVPDELDGAIVSSHYFLYEIDQEKVLRRFLDWFTKTDAFLSQIRAQGSTNYAAIRPHHVLDYQIPLPVHEEQHRIVAWLDGVKARLDERLAVIEEQEQETDAMLQAAFQRLIEDAPYRPMAEVAPLVRRQIEIVPDEEYTEIGVKSFYRGVFHRRRQAGLEFSWQKLFRIERGDLIFSNLMAWEQAIAVAGPNDHGCVGNHRMLTCQAASELATPNFLLFYFKTTDGFAAITGASPGSIARNKTLSVKLLPTIKAPVPPIDKQRWFDDLQARVQKIRDLRAATATEIDALLPAMLHRVFNGASGQPG